MNKKVFRLKELAEITGCKLIGDPEHLIHNVTDLETATETDASFLANLRYKQMMLKSKAGVICIDKATSPIDGRNYLVSDHPSRSFQKIVETFHPERKYPSGFRGIHPTAVLHESARIAESVRIGPHAIVDEGAIIGENTFIGSGSYIGPDSIIGKDCIIHPRVVIREECVIGNRVVIQPGAVIGSCGFGYTTDEKGIHAKINQVGNVVIEDDVEIGANTTIDRSRFKSTIVGNGSKLDNLIQIAHGVEVGPYNLMMAQTGIAGSTKTGKHVILAGQVAVAGHLHLNDGVIVAGKSGVTKSLEAGKYGGIPAVPLADYNRNAVFLKNIETFVDRLKSLEQKLDCLEKDLKQ